MGQTNGVPLCGVKKEPNSRKEVARAYAKRYGQPRPPVEHVVVLMLENRTFDNILGCWMDRRMKRGEVKPSKWDVHGKAGRGLYDFTNVVLPRDNRSENDSPRREEFVFPVWSRDPAKEDVMSETALGVPNGDPAEKFDLLNVCVFEDEDPDSDEEPTLGGFAQEYYEREMHDLEEADDGWVDKTDFEKLRSPAMHAFLPEQMSVFTELAENFGVSDTYFASAPCQTWPNRLFASSGHCYGYVNNLSDRGEAYDHDRMNVLETMGRLTQFSSDTVFDRLAAEGQEWSIFFGDFPLAVMINRTLQSPQNVAKTYPYSDFHKACKAGKLPAYTWVEPQYMKGPTGSPPTDMHPPHNVLYAQNLVSEVYNSLRSNEEMWSKTLFFITCDEGVGIFDHVPPPAAPDPKAGYGHQFFGQEHPYSMKQNPFKRYGTRVPLLLASPLVDPGTVLRPQGGDPEYPFDHTSIIRTVFDLFVDPECCLSERDRLAPSFAPLLRRTPRDDLGPEKISINRKLPDLVDHSKLRPNRQDRGGCHSVHHLIPHKSADSDAESGSPVLPRDDSGAALGGTGQMLHQMEHMQALFSQFGVGNRSSNPFHWLDLVGQENGSSSGSDSCTDSCTDSCSESGNSSEEPVKPLFKR